MIQLHSWVVVLAHRSDRNILATYCSIYNFVFFRSSQFHFSHPEFHLTKFLFFFFISINFISAISQTHSSHPECSREVARAQSAGSRRTTGRRSAVWSTTSSWTWRGAGGMPPLTALPKPKPPHNFFTFFSRLVSQTLIRIFISIPVIFHYNHRHVIHQFPTLVYFSETGSWLGSPVPSCPRPCFLFHPDSPFGLSAQEAPGAYGIRPSPCEDPAAKYWGTIRLNKFKSNTRLVF